MLSHVLCDVSPKFVEYCALGIFDLSLKAKLMARHLNCIERYAATACSRKNGRAIGMKLQKLKWSVKFRPLLSIWKMWNESAVSA